MNYWHMQMFPGNAPELDKNVPWIIQNRKFIGLGDWDEKRNQIGDFCERMQVNDIVAIKNGAEFIALVQIIGGVYSIKDDEDERTSWIVYRRPVRVLDWEIDGKSVFIVFVAGLPRKPKLPFADWYSTYARSFSKAVCSFPTRKNCARLPIALAIPQSGVIRFVWQSLPPHQSTPVLTKQMPYPCNHRQQGFFVPPQDYPAHVPMLAGSLFYP